MGFRAECLSAFFDRLVCLKAGAGISPRRATYFSLSRQRKVGKRKATPLSASPSLRYGATCGARGWRGLASTRFAQTIASPDPPAAALLGAHRGDQGQQGCCAALSLFCVFPGAKRSDGPTESPSGCACDAAMAGWQLCRVRQQLLRELTRCSCPSEVNAVNAASSAAHPASVAAQVARSEAEGRSQQGRLFFAYFLLAKQKKVGAPPGAHPGSCLSPLSKAQIHKEKVPQAPARQPPPAMVPIANTTETPPPQNSSTSDCAVAPTPATATPPPP